MSGICQSSTRFLGALSLIFWAFSATAQPDILQKAYDAHGVINLENAETLEVKHQTIDIWLGQDIAPGPPWQRSTGYRWLTADFVGKRLAYQIHMRHVGFYPRYVRGIFTPDGGAMLDMQEETWYPLPGGEAAFHREAVETKLTVAPWVILDAMNDPEASVVEEGGFTVISANLRDGTPVRLFIDPETGLLNRLERQDAPIAMEFKNYQNRQGLMVNEDTAFYFEGDLVSEIRLLRLALNGDIEALFEIPENYAEIERNDDPEARAFKVEELDPGVWFVGEGVFYQLFVEFEDFLVAVGGIGGVEKRLAAMGEITNKPLRYAIITHHHSDHLEGAQDLARAGATLIVGEGNEGVTREALGDVPGEIETVAKKRVISDGRQTLEIYQVGPGSHADSMIAAYLPNEKILYSGDLFVQQPGRPIRPRIPPIRDLVIAIETFDLDVENHLDPHSPRVTTIEEIYEAFRK